MSWLVAITETGNWTAKRGGNSPTPPFPLKIFKAVNNTTGRKGARDEWHCRLFSWFFQAAVISSSFLELKILYWDTDGLAIWYKRLEQGTFQFPTDGPKAKEDLQAGVEITHSQLSLLLGGIDLASARKRKRYAKENLKKV